MSEHCTYALLWKSPLFSTCTVLHFAVTFSSSFMSYVIDILFCICCHFNGCSLLEFTLTGFRICHYIACFIFAVIGLFISTILIYQRQQLVIHIYNILPELAAFHPRRNSCLLLCLYSSVVLSYCQEVVFYMAEILIFDHKSIWR